MSVTVSGIEESKLDEMALCDSRCHISWRELEGILNKIANALHSLDYGTRRFAVFARNSAETALAYLAGFEAGVSSVPIGFHLKAGEVAYILKDSGARMLFVGPETAALGLEAAAAAGVDLVVGWRCAPQPGLTPWEDWLAAASEAELPRDIAPMPHLHYTSGTTGTPKGTETPKVYIPDTETVEALAAVLRSRARPAPGLAVGPLYHTGPLSMVRNLFAGTSLVVMESFEPEEVLAAVERHRVANTVMVPTHFQRLLALPADVRAKYDLSSLQRITHTGAACPIDVKRRMIEWLGPVLYESYGGTEAGTTNTITSEEWLRKPGSVGRTIEPFEVVVVDDDGHGLSPNEVGRLFFRDKTGRGIIYHNDPQKTADVHLEPGVFTLGEMGYVDDDGYVFITDRVSDMIVSGGVNIYPKEAEHVLIRHEKVADIAIIGVPNPEMGEEAKALVVPVDADDPPVFDDLDRFCRSEIASYKCPRSYEIVPDIGRNQMGKVNKKDLRKSYWGSERTIGG